MIRGWLIDGTSTKRNSRRKRERLRFEEQKRNAGANFSDRVNGAMVADLEI